MQSYSVAEARNHFAEIVRDLEKTTRVEVTRRGKPVAVLISIEEYERMSAPRAGFLDRYEEFRKEFDLDNLGLDPDEIFRDVRDKAPGREVDL